jgi:hypothetical protein
VCLGVCGEVGEGFEPGAGGFGGVAGLEEEGPGAVLGFDDGAGGDGEELGEGGREGMVAEAEDGDEGFLGEVELAGRSGSPAWWWMVARRWFRAWGVRPVSSGCAQGVVPGPGGGGCGRGAGGSGRRV